MIKFSSISTLFVLCILSFTHYAAPAAAFNTLSVCKFMGSLLFNKTTQAVFDGEVIPIHNGPLPSKLEAQTPNVIRCWIPTVTNTTHFSSAPTSLPAQPTASQYVNADYGSVVVGTPYNKLQESRACFLGCDRVLYRITFSRQPNVKLNVFIIMRPYLWVCWLPVEQKSQRDNFKNICLPSPSSGLRAVRCRTRGKPLMLPSNAKKKPTYAIPFPGPEVPFSHFRRDIIAHIHCNRIFEYLIIAPAQRRNKFNRARISAQTVHTFDANLPPRTSSVPRCAVRAEQPNGALTLRPVWTSDVKTCEFGCDVIRYRLFLNGKMYTAEFMFMRLCTPYRFRTCAAPIGDIVQTKSPSFNPALPTSSAARLSIPTVQVVTTSQTDREKIIRLAIQKLRTRSSFSTITRQQVADVTVRRRNGREYAVILRFNQILQI